MKLTKEDKTREIYEEISIIDHQCFRGAEAPPPTELLRQFTQSDVFTIFSLVRGERYPLIKAYAIVQAFPSIANIWQIAVLPSWQGMGIGTDLLKEVIDAYKTPIQLTVKVDNNHGQVLYLKNGFRVKSILKNYYKPEGDGLLMRREFNG